MGTMYGPGDWQQTGYSGTGHPNAPDTDDCDNLGRDWPDMPQHRANPGDIVRMCEAQARTALRRQGKPETHPDYYPSLVGALETALADVCRRYDDVQRKLRSEVMALRDEIDEANA